MDVQVDLKKLGMPAMKPVNVLFFHDFVLFPRKHGEKTQMQNVTYCWLLTPNNTVAAVGLARQHPKEPCDHEMGKRYAFKDAVYNLCYLLGYRSAAEQKCVWDEFRRQLYEAKKKKGEAKNAAEVAQV